MNSAPQLLTIGHPEQLHRPDHVGAEDVDGAGDAGVAAGGEAVGVGAADQDRAGAEAERLDDVAAAADAAVHEDLDAAVDRVHDRRQHASEAGTPSS